MIEEVRTMRGAHFRLYWIWNRYNDLVHQGMYEADTRVYTQHLVGCTILANKSRAYIDAKDILLFSRFEHCSWE